MKTDAAFCDIRLLGERFAAGSQIGPYRVERLLGSGGMGYVYEATHEVLKVRRAVKVFGVTGTHVARHRDRFVAEVKTLAAIDHPRVVKVHDYGVDEGSGLPYFAMDLILSATGEPRTLEDERRAGASETKAALWLRDLCEGLDCVHAAGIAHRDVKLENVLIGADGHAVLSDFGICRIFDDRLRRRLDLSLTLPGEEGGLCGAGSVLYQAPELIGRADDAASARSDAWSLGVTMFRYLTGLWFSADARAKCLAVLADYDLAWAEVIDRLCADDPQARMGDAGLVDVCQSLERKRSGPMPFFAVAGCALLLLAAAVCGWRCLNRFATSRRMASQESLALSDPVSMRKPVVLHDPVLRPDAPTWREFYAKHLAAADAALLVGPVTNNPAMMTLVRHHVEVSKSGYDYVAWMLPQDRDFVDAEINRLVRRSDEGERSDYTAAQLFVLAGEVLAQKRVLAPRGEFPGDVERLGKLVGQFLWENRTTVADPEWVFYKLELLKVNREIDVFRRAADNATLQPYVDSSLMSTWHGCALSEADEQQSMCAIGAFTRAVRNPKAIYSAFRWKLWNSAGNPEACRVWFERCQAFCFDDLRVWMRYAHVLSQQGRGPQGALERLLELARETERYDTWVPAFYVTGRWYELANFKDGSADECDADERAWAYERPEVRERSLAVIRRYLDGEERLLADAPIYRRYNTVAVFAAVALTCGDEKLAARLVRILPDVSRSYYLVAAADRKTEVYRRLMELAGTPLLESKPKTVTIKIQRTNEVDRTSLESSVKSLIMGPGPAPKPESETCRD